MDASTWLVEKQFTHKQMKHITSNEGENTKSLEAVWRHQVITPAIHFHSSSSCLANRVTCAGILSGTRQIRQKWCEPGVYYAAPKNQHSTWKTVIGSFLLGFGIFSGAMSASLRECIRTSITSNVESETPIGTPEKWFIDFFELMKISLSVVSNGKYG